MYGRGVVGLVDQDGQLVVGEGHVLHGGRGVGAGASVSSIVRVGRLQTTRSMTDVCLG